MNRRSILRSAAYAAFFTLVLTTSFACGGGGGDGTTGVLTASFSPENPSPGAATVAMLPGSVSTTDFNVRITVTGTNDVYGAAFDITYPSNLISYQSIDSTTSFLRDGGATNLQFTVDPTSQAGRLVVVGTRLGVQPGVDVTGTRDLMILRFRARTGFSAQPILFDAGQPRQVRNDQNQAIAVTWTSGTASASAN